MFCALAILQHAQYELRHLEGWSLQVEQSLIEKHSSEWKDVQRELQKQLYQVVRGVPTTALSKLRNVTIWVHWTSPETKCMAYHPGAPWLREHKMNQDMAKGVEIGDAKNFLSWTGQQPWMVLHELAHAYHDQVLDKGFENVDVKTVFDQAMKSKRYESILHWNGTLVRHYGCNNQMEFFAETSESYFGTNDFYPFVSAELKSYDPEAYALMDRTWGKPH